MGKLCDSNQHVAVKSRVKDTQDGMYRATFTTFRWPSEPVICLNVFKGLCRIFATPKCNALKLPAVLG